MIGNGPGWYCVVAMNGTDRVATDLFGPFETRDDVVMWLTQYGVQYRPAGEWFIQPVPCFNEMTMDESENPWATNIHQRR